MIPVPVRSFLNFPVSIISSIISKYYISGCFGYLAISFNGTSSGCAASSSVLPKMQKSKVMSEDE